MSMFYIWMTNWKPFENMLILLFQKKIFHFQQLPKMAPMYRQTQKSLFFSKCNFEPLIIENIIFPIILKNVDFSEKWIF